MNDKKNYLHEIQQQTEYQILLRDHSDKAAQGLLTLLVTINVGAFLSVIQLLEKHYWLLLLFALSTISALLSRTGIYYIYRNEITMFETPEDHKRIASLGSTREKWWLFTEVTAWTSLISIILGIILLTYFFIT